MQEFVDCRVRVLQTGIDRRAARIFRFDLYVFEDEFYDCIFRFQELEFAYAQGRVFSNMLDVVDEVSAVFSGFGEDLCGCPVKESLYFR